MHLGRIFGLGAIVRSGLVTSGSEASEVAQELAAAADKKSFLREVWHPPVWASAPPPLQSFVPLVPVYLAYLTPPSPFALPLASLPHPLRLPWHLCFARNPIPFPPLLSLRIYP